MTGVHTPLQSTYYDALVALPETSQPSSISRVTFALLGFTVAVAFGAGFFNVAPVSNFAPTPSLRPLPRTLVALRGIMVDAGEFRKGTTVEFEGSPYKVVDFQHSKQARQAAVIRTRLQNMLTGGILEKNFRSGEKLEKVDIESSAMTFTYKDGDAYYFTSMETFAEERLSAKLLGDRALYLTEGLEVKVARYNGQTIDVDLPTTVDLRVAETEPGDQGDRVNAGTKPATLEGGKVIQVPLFVNAGDMIRVDTRDDRYMTRVK